MPSLVLIEKRADQREQKSQVTGLIPQRYRVPYHVAHQRRAERGEPYNQESYTRDYYGSRHNRWLSEHVQSDNARIKREVSDNPKGWLKRMKLRADRQLRHRVTKAEIEKAQWSDAQMKRRHNLSATTGYVGSTIGLTALGASALGSKVGGKGLARAAKLVPVGRRAQARQSIRTVRRQAKKATTPLLTAGAGVGGVGGLNFAAIQHQEAKKKPVQPKVVVVNRTVKKDFSAERNRHRRNKVEAGLLTTGGVASLGGAGHQFHQGMNVRTVNRALSTKRLGRAGGLVALGAGALAGGSALRRYGQTAKGRSYKTRYRPH